jgi:protein-S-isoprenylcysteine O-methyltransferase Ste14/phenylacetate-coenzyme A ligase PaaK-like adenylate-forming protein
VLARVAGSVAVGLYALALVVQMLRVRSTGYVIHRARRGLEKVIGLGMTLVSLGVAAWAVLLLTVDPAALRIASAPPWLTGIGVGLLGLALAVVLIAHAQMGAAWRMGIDRAPTRLITTGLFRLVRNPIYASTVILDAGLLFATPSPWTLGGTLLAALLVAVQARLEEEHLTELHGREYLEYAARVGRFLPGVGRLAPLDARAGGALGLIRRARRFDRLEPAGRRAQVRRRIEALVRACLDGSAFYRQRSAELLAQLLAADTNDRFFELFGQLPALGKADLAERFDAIVTDPEIRLERVAAFDREHPEGRSYLRTARGQHSVLKTSGTSGKIVYILDNAATQRGSVTLVLYRALLRVLWRKRALHLIVPFGKPLVAIGRLILGRGRRPAGKLRRSFGQRLLQALRPSLLVFVHRGNRSVYRSATGKTLPLWMRLIVNIEIISHEESLQSILEKTEALQPELIFGLPSRIEWLARAQQKGELAIAPAFVYAGGETLHPNLVELFRDAWPGCAVINTYGATETKPIALACAQCGELHVCEDLVYLELLDEQGGDAPAGAPAARVLATGLWNHVVPVLRYEMTDVIVPLDDAGCDWRTRRIRVAGREPAFLWVQRPKSAEWIPLNGRMLKERLTEVEGVRGFMVRQPRAERLELTFVIEQLADGEVTRIEAEARRCVAALVAEQGKATLDEVLPELVVSVYDPDGWNRVGGKLGAIQSSVKPPELEA